MISIKNLSSDLRWYVDVQKSINHEEHFGYMTRLDKIALDWSKVCSCHKRSIENNDKRSIIKEENIPNVTLRRHKKLAENLAKAAKASNKELKR